MDSVVLTIRIPRELKERMRRIDANWSEEIRRFIEERVRMYELLKLAEEVRGRARERRVEADSTVLIREDRERR